MSNQKQITRSLAASITKSASLQTYLTIRLLVDRELVHDAYRAYAYFRWVDDTLDERLPQRSERLAFLERQKTIIAAGCQGEEGKDVTAEEQMILDLIRKDPNAEGGLRAYIDNMMTVMAFDAERRGRFIGNVELNNYARALATAVTEALHYFIGHNCPTPHCEARYLAANGAHITHMLRDTLDDAKMGYFNIPGEYLESNQIGPADVESDIYRDWVRHRVEQARTYFNTGRSYLAKTPNFRCRLAGYAYIARFERVLDVIERDDYLLRSEYAECKTLAAGMKMIWSVLWSALNSKDSQIEAGALGQMRP